MSQHYLNPLFAPKSVAVFGASDRVDSVGQIVFQNMLESGYQGALYPVNAKNPEASTVSRRQSLSPPALAKPAPRGRLWSGRCWKMRAATASG
jgi:hypothetical protein